MMTHTRNTILILSSIVIFVLGAAWMRAWMPPPTQDDAPLKPYEPFDPPPVEKAPLVTPAPAEQKATVAQPKPVTAKPAPVTPKPVEQAKPKFREWWMTFTPPKRFDDTALQIYYHIRCEQFGYQGASNDEHYLRLIRLAGQRMRFLEDEFGFSRAELSHVICVATADTFGTDITCYH